MIDVDHQISSADRAVGSRTLSAGEARSLAVSRVYDTPPEDLWDACTNPERIPRWFLPISGDLRPGGRYALEGNGSGTIERCEPPHSLDATPASPRGPTPRRRAPPRSARPASTPASPPPDEARLAIASRP